MRYGKKKGILRHTPLKLPVGQFSLAPVQILYIVGRAETWGCNPVFALSLIPARFLCLASGQKTFHYRRSHFSWRPQAAAWRQKATANEAPAFNFFSLTLLTEAAASGRVAKRSRTVTPCWRSSRRSQSKYARNTRVGDLFPVADAPQTKCPRSISRL